MKQKFIEWIQRRLFSKKNLELEARIQALKILKENANITALVRAQLNGFDISTLNSDTDILSEFGDDEDAQKTFLNEVHNLSKNEAFARICNYVIRNCIRAGFYDAESITELNFNRASVNGIKLVNDEISALEGIWQDRHKPDEQYDATAVT